ncbi:class I SAM-dependent methyltransferase [Wenyingzhuangia sp. IMCC45467]
MEEFWEINFNQKQEMWGLKPAKSAVITKDFFVKKELKKILIPGIGYGRNAQVFINQEIEVTGIEISKTALELAQKHYKNKMILYHGSVTNMPFNDDTYDGVFCYALIHLLNKKERAKLIQDCYQQLNQNGYMFFTAISKKATNYGKGKLISKDRYEFHKGVSIFYYDKESILEEFEKYNIFEISEVYEDQPLFLIKCKKIN